jgi:hypothetical protein
MEDVDFASRNRIVAVSAPGMTTKQPPDRQIPAFEGPVFPDRFDAISGAARMEAAGRTQQGRKGDLIEADQPDHEFTQYAAE